MLLTGFKLRSLLTLVVFAALGLAVAVLSVQNHRLRVENARLRPIWHGLYPRVVLVGESVEYVSMVPVKSPHISMPDGPNAFAR